jgi:hypothetical protein
MDVCTLGRDQGGVLEIAIASGVAVPDAIAKLFADGCDAQHTPPEQAWPAIRHLTIAHLRAALGLDATPVGLDPTMAEAFPGLTVTYEEA